MARVNVDDSVWFDPRFKHLAALTGLDFHAALGRCVNIWALCMDRGRHYLPERDIDVVACLPGFSGALVKAGLAVMRRGTIYVSGAKDRVQWVQALRSRASSGGKARAAKSAREHGRFTSHMAGDMLKHPTSALALALAPALATSPALSNSKSTKASTLSESPETAKPASKKAARVVNPLHNEFRNWWCERFEREYEQPYGWSGKEAACVNKLLSLSAQNLENLKARAEVCLGADWPPGPKTLGVLLANFNRYAPGARVNGQSPLRGLSDLYQKFKSEEP